jgi:hypothetical protein
MRAEAQSSLFWDIRLGSPLKFNFRFGGICRLHLLPSGVQLANCFTLLSIFDNFYLEDVGEMFLRNVG